MKFFIITDLEGPAQVSSFKQTRDFQDCPELERQAKQLLTGEVNAAVDGILQACPGAAVTVLDGHGSGGLIHEDMHPQSTPIPHRSVRAPYSLDETYDGLFFVGQHAMAGTPDAPLCHTYSSLNIAYYKLNGRLIGEFGARAAIAGAFGVPTVFIAGDDKAVAEARELVPDIHAATVKQGRGLEEAEHLSHEDACELVKRNAKEAALNAATIEPFVIDGPYCLEIRVLDHVSIEPYLEKGAWKIDEHTVQLRSEELWGLPL